MQLKRDFPKRSVCKHLTSKLDPSSVSTETLSSKLSFSSTWAPTCRLEAVPALSECGSRNALNQTPRFRCAGKRNVAEVLYLFGMVLQLFVLPSGQTKWTDASPAQILPNSLEKPALVQFSPTERATSSFQTLNPESQTSHPKP